MSVADLRRRYRNRVAGHDWLEAITTALGVAFLLAAGACVWAVVISIASMGDPDRAFGTSTGFLQATRWFGIVLFAVFGVVTASVGWFLAGGWIGRLGARLKGRG
jgi:hypothetical protein